MVATEHLAASRRRRARQAGAKLILAGDDAQLASIERGGMFETLRQTHGAAILKDVQRVKDDRAKGRFRARCTRASFGRRSQPSTRPAASTGRKNKATPCATWRGATPPILRRHRTSAASCSPSPMPKWRR